MPPLRTEDLLRIATDTFSRSGGTPQHLDQAIRAPGGNPDAIRRAALAVARGSGPIGLRVGTMTFLIRSGLGLPREYDPDVASLAEDPEPHVRTAFAYLLIDPRRVHAEQRRSRVGPGLRPAAPERRLRPPSAGGLAAPVSRAAAGPADGRGPGRGPGFRAQPGHTGRGNP